MRILIITQYFWPENFRINDLALGLLERGHAVEVLTGIPNYPAGRFFDGYGAWKPRRESFKGIPILRVPLIPRLKGRGWNLVLNYLSFALSASVLGPVRGRSGYDAIFVFEPSPITVGLPAVVLKIMFGTPIFFWVQDLWPESLSATGAVRSEAILSGVRALVRFLYRHCERILIQSQAFKTPVISLGVPPEKIVYYPNSAESLYRPVKVESDALEREKVPAGFRVMFAGNIGAAQDFPTILRAAENLRAFKGIHFVILGDGRRYTWLQSQVSARGLGDTFHLLGRYPMKVMPRFFALADALLVTLKKDPIFKFTIPSKVQSYMACARPIIAALDGEGARVVKTAGAGFTTPAENPEGLTRAIKTLYEMPEEQRAEMGTNGLAYFKKNFERRLLLEQLEKIIEGTIRR